MEEYSVTSDSKIIKDLFCLDIIIKEITTSGKLGTHFHYTWIHTCIASVCVYGFLSKAVL